MPRRSRRALANSTLVASLGCAALAASAALGVGACAGWQRTDLRGHAALRERQQAQVWSRGQAQVLHAVTVRADTLFGVPFVRPPTCDSCRVAIPLAEVDSLRLGDMEAAGLVAILAPIVALALLAMVMYNSRGMT